MISGSKINNWPRVVFIFIIDRTYYVSTPQTNFVDFKGLLATSGIMWPNKVCWFKHCCLGLLALLLDSFCIVGWLLLCCYLILSHCCLAIQVFLHYCSTFFVLIFKPSCIVVCSSCIVVQQLVPLTSMFEPLGCCSSFLCCYSNLFALLFRSSYVVDVFNSFKFPF